MKIPRKFFSVDPNPYVPTPVKTLQRVENAEQAISELAARLEYIVNVKEYGAVGDGSDDNFAVNTAAFEAAEEALPETGGIIFVPNGVYVAAYRVRKQNVTVMGVGRGSVLKTRSDATRLVDDCPLRIFADWCTVRDLAIDGNDAGNPHLDTTELARQSDGIGIYASYCTVENVYVEKVLGHGIIVWNEAFAEEEHPVGARHHNSIRYNRLVKSASSYRSLIDIASTEDYGTNFDENINYSNEIIGNVLDEVITLHTAWDTLIMGNTTRQISAHTRSRGIKIIGNTCSMSIGVTSSLDAAISGNKAAQILVYGDLVGGDQNMRSKNVVAGGNNVASIIVKQADNVTISENTIKATGEAAIVLVYDTAVSILDNDISGYTQYGVAMWETNSHNTVISGNRFDNTVLESTSRGAVLASSAAGLKVADNTVTGIGRGVVTSDSVSNAEISRNKFIGLTGNALYLKVGTDTVVDGNIFQNCTIYVGWFEINGLIFRNNNFKTCTGGIRFEADCTGAIIEGNSFNTAGTKLYNLKSDTRFRSNIGYVTENSGTASVASGNTQVTVTHGLALTPTARHIKVTPTNNLGNASKFWISDIGATTFIINVDTDPGETTATFAWQAVVV
jgi:nitrous oxidase accessory protein NosD